MKQCALLFFLQLVEIQPLQRVLYMSADWMKVNQIFYFTALFIFDYQ